MEEEQNRRLSCRDLFTWDGIYHIYNSKMTWLILKAGLAATIFWSLLTFGSTLIDKETLTLDTTVLGMRRPAGSDVCGRDQFILQGMNHCHPLLTCQEIKSDQFKQGQYLGRGAIKYVYHAYWEGHDVAVTKLIWWRFGFRKKIYMKRTQIFRKLGPSRYINQFVGECGETHVTEYQSLGPANNLPKVIKMAGFNIEREMSLRFNICINYIEIIAFLHNSPIGTVVMCDSNSLQKTVSQYLLTTDLRLVLNDLDDVQIVNGTTPCGRNGNYTTPGGDQWNHTDPQSGKIRCMTSERNEEFNPPEQHWPYKDRPFVLEDQPPYDEKTDIYKIPPVCNWFLGDTDVSRRIKVDLVGINDRCRSDNPEDRPDASQVLEEYKKVWTKLQEKRRHV